ncbi:bile acid:sodium symporter family protein [Sphingomonas xinjiangensis]|uniref:Sodium/bile acid cotransporter 7 n=1 Tax=Sphingomonas xinjiangensis TaxID=643568 RepID=A0A840YL53_9SPHN|nr:bile acid:sodium symporter family protein [Sphingomonas xinjiangensis]MBB5710086.1 sodium/bile acid cotransporter 7 [Sphingomonas xinjiangensis]
MWSRILGLFEPFVLALLGTVALASILPVRGAAVPWFDALTTAGIVLLFFLHGAKLSREAIWEGARNWRLHLVVLATTFLLFPLLGLGFAALPLLDPAMAAGLLFLTLLPSTVQSSIAFTAIARGNVAAAVCSASFSNLIGIVVTPMLVALLMVLPGGQTGISAESIETIALQLLLPFVLGHAARPWIGSFVGRHKQLVSLVDRGSILLVVYAAFSAAVVEGLWRQVSGEELTLVLLSCCLLLGTVLLLTWLMGRWFGFPREDAVVLLFCGSKKSLASGVPMAGVLFPAAQVGAVLLPVMLFHQIQLIACAVIARRYATQAAD